MLKKLKRHIFENMCKVICKRCNTSFNIGINSYKDLDFELEDVYERNMGPEKYYRGVYGFECPKCKQYGELAIDCWEYPIGAYNYSEYEISEGEFRVENCNHESLCGEYISWLFGGENRED